MEDVIFRETIVCKKCGGEMEILGFKIEDELVIYKCHHCESRVELTYENAEEKNNYKPTLTGLENLTQTLLDGLDDEDNVEYLKNDRGEYTIQEDEDENGRMGKSMDRNNDYDSVTQPLQNDYDDREERDEIREEREERENEDQDDRNGWFD